MNTINGSRKTFSHTTTVHATPEQIFPLLCPVLEYEWIQGWECDLVYTESGVIEKNCIFTTNFSGIGRETWYVDDHIPNNHICFIRTSNNLSIRFEIDLIKNDDNTTDMRWTQMLTSMAENNTDLFMKITQESFSASVIERGQQLDYYIRTGSMMKR